MAKKKPTKREVWVVDQLLNNPVFDPEANAEPINIAREVETLLGRGTFEDAFWEARWKQEFYRSKPGFEEMIKAWAEIERIIVERWGKDDHNVGSKRDIPPTTH